MSRPTRARVDLSALQHNYRVACEASPGSKTIAVIKANAYGHGAVHVARALNEIAPVFAVACIEEAIELREGGIEKPVLLLEGPLSADEVQIAGEQNFWLMASGTEQVETICRAQVKQSLRVWLKVDSGMHRLGIQEADFASCYSKLKSAEHVDNEIVIATHFASADNTASDTTKQQIELFQGLLADVDAPTSLANSAGLLHWENARSDWNRAGILLYGASPFEQPHPNGDKLLPVMNLESQVIGVRDIPAGESVGYSDLWVAERPSRIATVAIGYGDGYPRSAPSGTPVLVNGVRAPLAGRVSMDMITVDVTDLPSVNVGDPVELWGKTIPVNEVAQAAGTISYELLTRMPLRPKREYV